MKLEIRNYNIEDLSYEELDNGLIKFTFVIQSFITEEQYKKYKQIIHHYYKKLTLEVEKQILDDVEKEYLSGFIKPFRDKVIGIYKYNSVLSDYEEIAIDTRADYNCNHITHLPPFKKSTMYKNMELNKVYSLEELNL